MNCGICDQLPYDYNKIQMELDKFKRFESHNLLRQSS